MSSYHILNAIIVGIFPMLIVSILVGFICYLFCCISQIKTKFKEYKQKKEFNRARKHLLKKYATENSEQEIDQTKTHSTSSNNNEEIIQSQIKLYHYQPPDFNPLMSTPTFQDNSNNKNLVISREKDTPTSRSSLKLNLINTFDNNNDQISNNYSDCKTIINNNQCLPSNNNKKYDSFVIIELDESPKGVFTRMQQLAFYGKDNFSNKSPPPPPPAPEIKINNESTRSKTKNQVKNILNNKYFDDDEDAEDYNDTNNEDTEQNSIASLSSLNDKQLDPNLPNNNNIKIKKQMLNNYINNSQIKKVRKKLNSNPQRSYSGNKINYSSESQTEFSSVINKRPKLLTLSKNRVQSDVELMEDDIMFHDDDDSLSSAGICELTSGSGGLGRIPSQNTLVLNTKDLSNMNNSTINNHPNFNQSTPNSIDQNSISLLHSKNQIYFKKQFRSNLINSSSMSDIDPDENILKNLLIKNKINESSLNNKMNKNQA